MANLSVNDRNLLNEIARMAYGSGVFEKTSGGKGNIGLFTTQDGQTRVVKFNTHFGERGGAVTADMLRTSNALRQSLLDIAGRAGLDEQALAGIRKSLGLGPDQNVGDCKSLLTRKITAAVVKAIGGDNAMQEAMAGVNARALKSRGSTKFDDVTRRAHFDLAQRLAELGLDSVKLPFSPSSPKAEKFCGMVDKYVDMTLRKLGGRQQRDTTYAVNKMLGRPREEKVTREDVRLAVLKSLITDPVILATFGTPKKVSGKVLDQIKKQQDEGVKASWQKMMARPSDHEMASGFNNDFLRVQSSGSYYKGFTFNGETPPEGKAGEAIESYGQIRAAQTNAGLQRKMKEMIPDPRIRALVTAMCGLEGLAAAVSDVATSMWMASTDKSADPGMNDLGFGKVSDFMGNRFLNNHADSASVRFDLTVDKDNNLIFRQTINATPEVRSLLGYTVDQGERIVLSKNELSVTMKIPLGQELKDGEMPRYEMLGIEQNIDAGA